MNKIDTIVVGAGVAGLGCARTLHAKGIDDFLVIAEDVGGRILTSDDGQVNYGAFFVLDSYRYVKQFTTLRYKINPIRVAFHSPKGARYNLISASRHPIEMLRLIRIVKRFESLYEQFMLDCETLGQKKALEANPELMRLYSLPAREYVREAKIENIADRYVSEAVYSFSFVGLDDISALDLLRISTILIVPTYGFSFDQERALAGFEDKILTDRVVSYRRNKDSYIVKTKKGAEYSCTNLVFAVPPKQTQKFFDLPEIKGGAPAYITHLTGTIKDTHREYQYYNVYSTEGDVIAIVQESNGSYIFASLSADTDLGIYFNDYSVIAVKHWDPAFNLRVSGVLYEASRGDGLYMIGDYNITGMEDAYITGVYAANRIMGSHQ